MSKTLTDATTKTPTQNIDPRILLLALGMFALGTDAFVIAGVLPVIARDMQVTEGLAGQLVTVFSLTYGLGAPVLAALTGRWPRHRVLIIALGAFCLINVGSALAPSFSLLGLTRILAACFAALYSPLAYTIGTALAAPEKRGQALSFVLGGLTLSTVLGSPLGTWVGEHFGWRMSFGMVALLAGVACIALLLCGLPRESAAPTLSLQARLAPIREPRLLLALLPALLWNLGIYVVYTYLAPIFQQNMHITDISVALLVFGLGAVPGNWLGGLITDRFGSSRPLITGFVVLAMILLGIPFATSLFFGLPLLLLWGLCGPNLFIAQQHRMLSLAPEHANVILALNNSMLYLGIAGGAALGGIVLHTQPVAWLGPLGAVCSLLALLALLFSMRIKRTA
ncbi:MFS transporter [Reticulibacter mediterranei]|uniref:MFS transporter n=1 Tax=Reticulibacter mediterranei TaxID=2778369 RepID=A0A8J3N760_9CHLR|nr:MFS transporter [Reticulibacter mediterranei]GHO98273.1 MFS transporter [Reticulibacter mediterranei]